MPDESGGLPCGAEDAVDPIVSYDHRTWHICYELTVKVRRVRDTSTGADLRKGGEYIE